MGMGLLFAGLSGAGKGLSESAVQSQKFSDEQALMQERARLEEEKQLRIDEVTRQRNAAPLNRLQALTQQAAGEDVPVEAEPVTATTSAGAKEAGLQDGLIGMTREQVLAYKDPAMLAQYDKQIAADNKLAQGAVAGQTRKRTSDEAFDAGMANAQTNDLEAYKAGTGLLSVRKDLRNADNADRRADQADKRQADSVDANKRAQDRQDLLAQSRIEVDQAKIALEYAQSNGASAREVSALKREQINATKAAWNAVNAETKSLEKELADPMLSEAQKIVVKRQLDASRAVAKSYRDALSEAGLMGSAVKQEDVQESDPLGIRKSFQQPQASNSKGAAQANALPPSKQEAQKKQQQAQPQKSDDSIDVSGDIVLKTLKQQISELDKTDPKNTQKMMALGTALNDRRKQLQDKYGSMTNITGY